MKKNIVIKLFGMLMICMAAITIARVSVHAEEYEKLEYKTVKSFEEYWELNESDDVAMTFTSEQLSNLEKIWYIDIEEPGWFIFSNYNYNIDNYGSRNLYMFTSTMFTDKVPMYTEKKLIGGDTYESRYNARWYLAKGRYYFKLKDENTNTGISGDKIARFRFYLIPSEIELKIDSISYNDDNSVATVLFTPISENIWSIYFYDKEIRKTDAMFDTSSSHCLLYLSSSDADKKESAVKDGIEVKKNGTYSLIIYLGDDEYRNYYAVATFTIDKIGAEASKIEAKSLKMSKTKATLKIKDTLTLKVTFKPKNVTEKKVTWKSSNTKVATVDENGKVTAKKKGTCTITAVSSNGKKAKCKITVKK